MNSFLIEQTFKYNDFSLFYIVRHDYVTVNDGYRGDSVIGESNVKKCWKKKKKKNDQRRYFRRSAIGGQRWFDESLPIGYYCYYVFSSFSSSTSRLC